MKEEIIRLLRETNRNGMDKVIEFLEKSDFFTAPASTRFHGAYEGGLAEHSFKVYEIDPYQASDVAELGSFRALTRTFKEGFYTH